MIRIVHSKILGGWFIVRGSHMTPIGGRFDSKAAALQHLRGALVKSVEKARPCHAPTLCTIARQRAHQRPGRGPSRSRYPLPATRPTLSPRGHQRPTRQPCPLHPTEENQTMTDKHTPGPWFAHGRNILNSASCKGNSCRQLAHISDMPDEMTAEELQANARLIAQAPAMLRALQRLTHPMADDDDLAHAQHVIARATGQPVPDDDEGPEPPYAGYESQAVLDRQNEVRRLEALRVKGLIP